MKKAIVIASLALGAMLAAPVYAADQPSKEQVQIALDKIKADKKYLVSQNLTLSAAEASAFWPVYDEYQNGLDQINGRILARLSEYAGVFNSNTMTDDEALKLLNEQLSIESDELALKKAMQPKLQKVLSGVKTARYMQLENKLRAILKYEIAGKVPLIGDKPVSQ